MKTGFKPKAMTKKEWQDNRSRACHGSGVGKALDQWQKSCPSKIGTLNLVQIKQAEQVCKLLKTALDTAAKKCDK